MGLCAAVSPLTFMLHPHYYILFIKCITVATFEPVVHTTPEFPSSQTIKITPKIGLLTRNV